MFQTGQPVQSKSWQPVIDQGKHYRARLGFILMSTDLAAESDFFAMAPQGVAVHITRLKTDDYTTNETLSRHIEHMADAAARIQPDTKPNVVSYSCTSGSITLYKNGSAHPSITYFQILWCHMIDETLSHPYMWIFSENVIYF